VSESVSKQWQAYLGSFTQVIQALSDQLVFSFLGAKERPLTKAEGEALGLSAGYPAWVREVAWSYEDVPQVSASAIIPVADTTTFQRLREWGDQPLGKLLYTDPELVECDSVLLPPEEGYAIHRQRELRFHGHALLSVERLTPAFLRTWEHEISAVLSRGVHE